MFSIKNMLRVKRKPTYAGFCEFVAAQPADRTINNSGGWSHCAVGDYIKHTLKVKPRSVSNLDASDFACHTLPERVYCNLGTHRAADYVARTYGDLHTFLTDYNLKAA